MRNAAFLCALILFSCVPLIAAEESAFDGFLTKFDYETRTDMKIDSNHFQPFHYRHLCAERMKLFQCFILQ